MKNCSEIGKFLNWQYFPLDIYVFLLGKWEGCGNIMQSWVFSNRGEGWALQKKPEKMQRDPLMLSFHYFWTRDANTLRAYTKVKSLMHKNLHHQGIYAWCS